VGALALKIFRIKAPADILPARVPIGGAVMRVIRRVIWRIEDAAAKLDLWSDYGNNTLYTVFGVVVIGIGVLVGGYHLLSSDAQAATAAVEVQTAQK
jgi:hypothetical protein